MSKATYVKYGFGQVEPNHLSAQRTAQIYAQLPVVSTIDMVENGQFLKYNYAANVCDCAGAGEWMLVFNEVKVYGERETDADFAMKRVKGEEIVPRVFKTNIGDIFTTNTIKEETLAVNDELVVGDDGYLTKTAGDKAGDMKWQVVKVYTLADGQPAVKIMRIA
jgi:hypothetical protein